MSKPVSALPKHEVLEEYTVKVSLPTAWGVKRKAEAIRHVDASDLMAVIHNAIMKAFLGRHPLIGVKVEIAPRDSCESELGDLFG